MINDNNRFSPILVTGAHRSGTTWVGKTLARAPGVTYIHEPFNLMHRRGILNVPIEKWYTYVSEENNNDFYGAVKAMLEFRYSLIPEMSSLKSITDLGRMMRDFWRTSYFNITHARPLIKDPFAVFSAPWFFNKFHARVLILVRHPAAFVSSIMERGWDFPFRHFLEQPNLIQDHLQPFSAEIEEFAYRQSPLIDQAILIWRSIYHVVNKFRQVYPSWSVIKHEDLSINPVEKFAHLYGDLGLDWTTKVKLFIEKSTNSKNSSDTTSTRVLDINRNSQENIKYWKMRLKEDEINYIREASEDVSTCFYSAQDWL